jgi:protein involved in polysaccharide export with SLBB domain
VSVLGEVARPGVYPYTLHHRLLDLISSAAGLSQNAGRLVNVFHRSDPNTPHPVVLDPGGTDTGTDHNPELSPGDTVQVSRAGLVYVIGDVVRPGGFPVDPAQGLTVVQALSLAWGPSQNAAAGKALLIREQKGGRTLTTLNLRRMIHGQDPDQPIYDRDILFVPDSMAKNMWNRTMEAAIQSAVGVTIYAEPCLLAEVLGMRRIAWALLLLFAFAIPWEYSLDLGEPLGNIARIAGILLLARCHSSRSAGGTSAHSRPHAVAGSGFLPLVLLLLSLDHRTLATLEKCAATFRR